MTKPLPRTSKAAASRYVQDPFDKAFIKVLYTLQTEHGKCLNESWVEEQIGLPKRHIYQIKKGLRGVALTRRDDVLKFFDRYDVDPRYFFNTSSKMFRHSPPLLQEAEEAYQVKAKTNISSGKLLQAEKLEAEVKSLREQLAVLRRENAALQKLVALYEKEKK